MQKDIYRSQAMKFTPVIGGILLLGLLSSAEAQISVQNGDFELGTANWNLFVPQESATAGCQFSVEDTAAHSGQKAARLRATQKARFGINYFQNLVLPIKVGHLYRLTAWVKAGADFATDPDTPGPVLRATLFDRQMKDVAGGHIFVGLQGVQRGDPSPLRGAPVPTNWTKIEGVVEIPPGTVTLILFVFCWKTSGTLWVDDVSVVEVDASGSPVP